MAEIRTTRMRLVQWTEGTDSPQRVDFNETFLNVETLAAIDQQGTIGNRSTPSKTGMYYFATDEGILYRSDGQAWAVVGSSTLSHLIRAARTDSVSLTIQAITGQTADLLRLTTTSGGTLVRVRPNGDVLAGALRVSQAARTTTASDTAPTDSAVTVDNNSTGMWNTTAKNTTGNTAGYFRAIRGTSTVFSVGPDGSVSTPAVTLTSAPSSDSHAVRRTDLTSSVANATYNLDSANITGTLPISKGGTGRTAASPGAYPRWSADGNSFDGVTPANLRADIDAATSGHGHALTDSNITGVLPVAQGGTGATSVTAARTALDVPSTSIAINTGAGLSGGGTLAASRTLQVVFEGNGTKTTAARSDHGHSLTDANVTGVLPVAQGGTGGTSTATARNGIEAAYEGRQIATGAGLNGGGDLTEDRSLSVVFPSVDFTYDGGVSTGSADIAARYNHEHNLAGDYLKGNLPWEKNSIPVALTTEDLNSVTATGLYYQNRSADATAARNYPGVGYAGTLQVIGTQGSMTYQHYTDYYANGSIWRRVLYRGSWSAWDRVITSTYLDAEWVDLPDTGNAVGMSYGPKQIQRVGNKRYVRGQITRPDGNAYSYTSGLGYMVAPLSAQDVPRYGTRVPVTPVHNGTGSVTDGQAYVAVSPSNSEIRLHVIAGTFGRVDLGMIVYDVD